MRYETNPNCSSGNSNSSGGDDYSYAQSGNYEVIFSSWITADNVLINGTSDSESIKIYSATDTAVGVVRVEGHGENVTVNARVC